MSRILTRSLQPGDQVGRYRVEAFLGAGGMGEVYRAEDGTLGRAVALKVLPVSLLSEERIRRFMAEAQNASRLEHPAIVTIHDTGRTSTNGSSVYFLAMELIEGDTLASPARARDLPRNLELMAQVADGLAVAHAHGIVHRDLKPENIIVSRDGFAKILDFGISKLSEPNGPREAKDRTTDPATILGTVSYMSPEQATGREVDQRSDIFSFGSVLYELVTGRAPFDGPSQVDTLHNILHLDPPMPEKVPAELNRILRKCLARDRDQRYHSIKDVALDLRELVRELQREHEQAFPPPRHRRAIALALAGAVLIALALVTLRRSSLDDREKAAPAVMTKMTRLTFTGNVMAGAISPDGNYVVHAIREREMESLWVKQIATGSLIRLAEPDHVYYNRIRVSPDGNYVYFSSAERRDPNLLNIHQIPLLGGEQRRIISDIDGSFTISPDGKKIAFVRFNAVERAPKIVVAEVDDGVERILLKRPSRTAFGGLSWSPDGESIAFVALPDKPEGRRNIEQVRVADGTTSLLFPTKFAFVGTVQWMPDRSGVVITASDRDQPSQLWFLPYPAGEPKQITSDIVAYVDPTLTRDGRAIGAGRLESSSNLWLVKPGERVPPAPLTTGLANLYGCPVWTRDGEILFTSFRQNSNLCMIESATIVAASKGSVTAALAPESIRQLTRGRDMGDLVVSPTEPRIAYLSDDSGPLEVWVSDLDGSNARQVTRNGRTIAPGFFPDGKSIVYVAPDRQQFAYKMSLVDGSVQPLTDKPTNSTRISPDGKWLLCRYREPEPGKPLWRTTLLSLDGGKTKRFFDVPRYGGPPRLKWLPDGKSFSFVDWKDGVANVWIQAIDGGEPRQATFFDSGSIYGYDWSADGSQLAVTQGNPVADGVLITNFR